jgi:hypothetical protein
VKNPPVIREFGLDRVGQITAGPELIEGERIEIDQKLGFPDLVNPTALQLRPLGITPVH